MAIIHLLPTRFASARIIRTENPIGAPFCTSPRVRSMREKGSISQAWAGINALIIPGLGPEGGLTSPATRLESDLPRRIRRRLTRPPTPAKARRFPADRRGHPQDEFHFPFSHRQRPCDLRHAHAAVGQRPHRSGPVLGRLHVFLTQNVARIRGLRWRKRPADAAPGRNLQSRGRGARLRRPSLGRSVPTPLPILRSWPLGRAPPPPQRRRRALCKASRAACWRFKWRFIRTVATIKTPTIRLRAPVAIPQSQTATVRALIPSGPPFGPGLSHWERRPARRPPSPTEDGG